MAGCFISCKLRTMCKNTFNKTIPSQAVTMNPVLSSVQSMREMFDGKTQDFIDEIQNVHIVWLEEIQQEANRMFSR